MFMLKFTECILFFVSGWIDMLEGVNGEYVTADL